MLERVVSGGQTGVDRAALDTALRLDIPVGGWCPAGRRAEDGPISLAYPLQETPHPEYEIRTEWNVRDSDGTLILCWGPLEGGTALTAALARKHNRPCHIADLAADAQIEPCIAWLEEEHIRILNIAGPRASTFPQIYQATALYLEALFAAL